MRYLKYAALLGILVLSMSALQTRRFESQSEWVRLASESGASRMRVRLLPVFSVRLRALRILGP